MEIQLQPLLDKLTSEGAERIASQLLFLGHPYAEKLRELAECNTRQADRLQQLEDQIKREVEQQNAVVDQVKKLDELLFKERHTFRSPKFGARLRVLVDRSRTNPDPANRTLDKGTIVTAEWLSGWISPATDANPGDNCNAINVRDVDGVYHVYLLDEVEPE